MMLSFTNRFVAIFAACAVCALFAYVAPAALVAVAAGVSVLVWLAVFDYLFTRPAFEALRILPPRAGLGRACAVELLFVNTGGARYFIEAEDTPPEDCTHENRRHALTLGPHARDGYSYEVVPRKRGDLAFGPLHVRVRGRLGLVRKRFEVTPDVSVLKVFPDLSELRKYELLARKGYYYMPGLRPSRYRGRGTAFEMMREYSPDDDYQRINWKATARLSRPVVMEFEVEKHQNVFLMIDTGRLMGLDVFGQTKLDHAMRAALVLAGVCAIKGDNVGVLTFSRDVGAFLPPAHGRAQLSRCVDMMYNLEPAEDESDYAKAFEFLFSKKLKRSLIVVFSDFVDMHASEALVRYLSRLHPAHLPLCVTLRDSNIEDASSEMPPDLRGVYRKTAALAMLERRNAVFHSLSRRGVNIINTRPEKLSSDVINKYLELKGRLAF